jgi:hypothetical protein
MVAMTFNAADAPADTGEFAPIAAGDYPMRVINSEIKQSGPNSKNPGTNFLKLEMEITDGPSAGRKHWENLNLWHPDQQTKDIAQRSLAQLCSAVGLLAIQETEELHFKPFTGKLKVTPAKGQYGPGNAIAGYKSAGGGSGPAQASSGASASPAPASGGGKPKAYKHEGKWVDENGDAVPFFKLAQYEKVEG